MGGAGDDLHSVVMFRLGGQLFAIPVTDVREVVPYAWLERPPRMPAFVQGVLNLAGTAVPVLRLDRLLGLAQPSFGLESSILIMTGADGGIGLLVDHVEGVRATADFQFSAIDDGQSFQGCVSGQMHGPLGSAHLLSWRQVLLEEERQRLEQFRLDAEQRLAQLSEGEG